MPLVTRRLVVAITGGWRGPAITLFLLLASGAGGGPVPLPTSSRRRADGDGVGPLRGLAAGTTAPGRRRALEATTTDWGIISPLLVPPVDTPLPEVPPLDYAQALHSSAAAAVVGGEAFTIAASAETTSLCPDQWPPSSSTTEAILAGPAHVCTSDTCSGPGYEAGTTHCRASFNSISVALRGKLGTWWARALGSPAWATFTFPAVPETANSFSLGFKIDFRYRPELYGGNACAAGSDAHSCALCTGGGPWDHQVPPGVHVLWSAAGRNDYVITGPIDGLGEAWDDDNFVLDLEAPEDLDLKAGEYPVVTFLTFSQYGAYGEVSNPSHCSVGNSNDGPHTYKDKALMLTEASLSYDNVPTDPPSPAPTMPPETQWGLISPLLEDEELEQTLPTIPPAADAAIIYGGASPTVVAAGDDYDVIATAESTALCSSDSSASNAPIRAGPAHVCTADTCSGPGYEVGTTHCRASFNSISVILRGKLGTWWARALGPPAWATFTFPAVPETANTFSLGFELDFRYRPELYGGNACDAGSEAYSCALCTGEGPWDHQVPPGVHVLWSAAGRNDYVITGPIDGLGEAWDDGNYVHDLEAPEELDLKAGEYPVVTFFTFSQYGAYGEVSNPSHCSVGNSNDGPHTYKDKALMLTEASFKYGVAAVSIPTLPPTSVPSPLPTKEPTEPTSTHTSNTDWDIISSTLEDPSLAWSLPPVPSSAEAVDVYQGVVVGDGAPFGLYSLSGFDDAELCGQSGDLPVRGGPSHVCTSDTCNGPGYEPGTTHCGVVHNSPSLQLRTRLGTYWAKALGTPAWMQFIFPAVPEGSTKFSLRFTLDERYRPELYGGNPCSGASDSYNCALCTTGPWDHSMAAGVHILWSAAGRDRHVITGPFDFSTSWDDGVLTQQLEPPPELILLPGEYPTVTFMTAFQYPAVGEVPDPNQCSIGQSSEGGNTFKDKAFMLKEASLMYRSDLVLPQAPSTERPRLYGTDEEWIANFVQPFFDAPCDSNGAPNAGWFGEAGFLDIKSNFDLAARGFKSCSGAPTGWDLESWYSTNHYMDDNSSSTPSRTDGYRALHLLRRLWACADASGGSFAGCEFSEGETNELAAAVLVKELERFADATWSCGASCGGSGDPVFDLTTAEQVSYFTVFYDVMSSRPGLLPPQDASAIATALRNQIELFRNAFWTGQWQLWNGNNWTPHLCVAALEWAITFWHEEVVASEILGIVNDIMWLHRPYYTSDGTYTEGVIMYSIMSIEGQMAMAALQRASFGAAPAAISVGDLQRVSRYMLASMSSDGYMVDFGDSHRNRGWSTQFSLVEAALAATMIHGDPVTTESSMLDSSQMRSFFSSLYGSGGFYSNPWRLRPGVLQMNAIVSLRDPPLHPSQPLGPLRSDVFPVGGYAAILAPLLDVTYQETPPCFGSDIQQLCINQALPSLADNIPYSFIAMQARPNRFSHSEVDFGQVTWSAWGTRLLSEFSYGTIATSVNEWDMRRYQYIDNNPAGHNTVVIREAFQEGSSEINFSQLTHVDGTLSEVTAGLQQCILLDGSNVYGAQRDDGWLDVFHRYSCALPHVAGTFLLVDVVKVKANRSPLSLYGSQYGGPSFYESEPASQTLHIDEYFYTDTSASFDVIDGVPHELPFDRSNLSPGDSKWCNHVDVTLQPGNASVALQPQCGLGSYRDADGIGLVSGISTAGQGRFEYDGLVTSVDRWFNPHALKKRRFRFVSDHAVGAEGDVRAFILAPSAQESSHEAPHVQLDLCTQDFGCEEGVGSVQCSCVQMCVGESLQWAVVLDSELKFVGPVGTCSASLGNTIDPELVDAAKESVGITFTSRW